MSHCLLLIHVIFRTKSNERTLFKERREDLYRYIHGVLLKKNCRLIIVNGVEDHLHLLIEIRPAVCLSDLVRDLKSGTNKWIRENRVFPCFMGWNHEYAAFTVSPSARDSVMRYIANQEVHHSKQSFEKEYREILSRSGMDFDDKYVLDDK